MSSSTNWTSPADLRAQLQKLWDRGELLGGMVDPDYLTSISGLPRGRSGPLFPRRLLLKGPTSAEISERFADVRCWIAELRGVENCRIEMREFRHRVLGDNALPAEVWIDRLDDAVALIGKRRDMARFSALLDMTRQRLPALQGWLARRPLRALELAEEWGRLLQIVAWIQTNPRPGVYLRQVDIPGVHSKFIEAHRGVLVELLDSVLPPEAFDTTASGVSQFARRYGFSEKPLRVRFRRLDPDSLVNEQDITLDCGSFSRLQCSISRVFITENEVNFLAFPLTPGSLVVFGAGYGFDALALAAWLAGCQIFYWGDIDTHGFAILDQLRSRFGHVESFLMDRDTLLAFESQWGVEDQPTARDLPRLTATERALYDDLRDNRIRNSLRLEQERVGFAWVSKALAEINCEGRWKARR